MISEKEFYKDLPECLRKKMSNASKAFWNTLTPEERSSRARNAAKKKWENMTQEQRDNHISKLRSGLKNKTKVV